MQSTTNYTKVASHEAHKGEFKTCLLLYSGGLDTSTMLKWIQDEYECDIITLTVDIGQTADDLEAIKEKALKLGAKKAIVYDAKEDFGKLLTTAIKANANYQDGYALSTPMGRIIISQIAVEVAEQESCEVISHGCTGKGNDQVRFDSYITTLNPKLKIVAPVREWSMGRDEQIEYAAKHGIPIKQTKDKPYSYDENMWGNTGEGGEIENPEEVPQYDKIQQWVSLPKAAPDNEETLEISFEKGIPNQLNGKPLSPAQIIQLCNKVGAKHGVGVETLIEDRFVGLKVRGVYEQSGAAILIKAHQKLEQLVSTREENKLKHELDHKWAYLVYEGKWFDPVISHINAYIDHMNEKVTGTAKVKLYKGNIDVVSVSSPYSLFDHNLATFNKSADFNQNASAGFIEIYNLPQKTAYNVFHN